TVIGLEDLRSHISEEAVLPEKSVLLTFDDGDVSVFEKGLPVLRNLAVPAVLFVITDLIDTSDTFWCRWVEKVYENRGLSYAEARKKVNELKNVPEQKRRQYIRS